MIRAPEHLQTARLVLRRPTFSDLQAIFDRYASDPEVTRYLAWPTHQTLDDTRHFLALSDAEWNRYPAGPYVVEREGVLIGSCGLTFHDRDEVLLGYVLSRDAWGQGYASECARALLELAHDLSARRVAAHCDPRNTASLHVLTKAGLVVQGPPELVESPYGEMVQRLKFVLPA